MTRAHARSAGGVLSRLAPRSELRMSRPARNVRPPAKRFAIAAKAWPRPLLDTRGDARPAESSRAEGRGRPEGSSPVPTISAQSIRTRTHPHSDSDFAPLTRTSTARSFRHTNREQASLGRFEPSRQSARTHPPSDRVWRAKSQETTTTHSSTRVHDFAMRRAVDLVWRANPSSSAVAESLPQSGAPTAMPASSARSTLASAHGPTPASRTSDKTVVCASALDPVLADRLADDVIRRIDRRARIERERRGP